MHCVSAAASSTPFQVNTNGENDEHAPTSYVSTSIFYVVQHPCDRELLTLLQWNLSHFISNSGASCFIKPFYGTIKHLASRLGEDGLRKESKLPWAEQIEQNISPSWTTSYFLIGQKAFSKRKQCFHWMLSFTGHRSFKSCIVSKEQYQCRKLWTH